MTSDQYTHQGDLFRHELTQCAWCGELLHQDEAAVHDYFDDQGPQSEVFCPTSLEDTSSCQQQWYMQRQRELDGQ